MARRRERRLAGPLVLSSLPPGRYVVHAGPAVYGTGDALAGTFMPCTLEVELPAAATVRRSLLLERGGCLRIHSGTLSAPGERLSFRVLDAGGAERRVRFVTDDEPDTYGFLPVDRDVRTAPALPAGLYELEVWDDAGVRRKLPFELRAGAETALGPR